MRKLSGPKRERHGCDSCSAPEVACASCAVVCATGRYSEYVGPWPDPESDPESLLARRGAGRSSVDRPNHPRHYERATWHNCIFGAKTSLRMRTDGRTERVCFPASWSGRVVGAGCAECWRYVELPQGVLFDVRALGVPAAVPEPRSGGGTAPTSAHRGGRPIVSRGAVEDAVTGSDAEGCSDG